LSGFWRFVRGLRDLGQPALAVNLSPSRPARLLTHLLQAEETRGLSLDAYGFGVSDTPWATYLQAAATSRVASPFNVVDIFRRMAKLAPSSGRIRLATPGQEQLAATAQALGTSGHATSGYLGLQLGASEERRRWPTAYFARLGDMAWQELGLMPVLLGSPGEGRLAQAYKAKAEGPCVDLVGGTDLPGLAAAVASLSLLVTNDTGTMHLAAGLGVPLAGIFLATAQPWDTGPCLPGSLCLEPDLDCHPCAFGTACPHDERCRHQIKPETIMAHVRAWQAEEKWPHMPGCGARTWRVDPDEQGFHGLTSLSGHGQGDDFTWMLLLRQVLKRHLDGCNETLPGQILSPDARSDMTRVLHEAGGLLTMLRSQGQLLAMQPRDALKTKFLAGWQRFGALLTGHPRFAPLGALMAAEAQEQGGDLTSLLGCLERNASLLASIELSVSSGGNVGMEVDILPAT
jgi:ADP-heptose:LPS heptosyltransferase